MPHKSLNSQPLLPSEKERVADAPTVSACRKRKAPLGIKRRRRSTTRNGSDNLDLPTLPRVMRIRRLIMAALRVWELKHGIHEPRWNDLDEPLWGLEFDQPEFLQAVADEL